MLCWGSPQRQTQQRGGGPMTQDIHVQEGAERGNTATSPQRRRRLLFADAWGVANRNFIWAILVALFLIASMVVNGFTRPLNVTAIVVAVTYLGCLTVAQTFVLISGHFDLSTEANMVFSACVAGLLATPVLMTKVGGVVHQGGGLGLPWPIALVLMLVVSTAIGVLNGLMVIKLRMNALMVTLAMQILLGGAAIAVASSRQFTALPDGFTYLGRSHVGPVPLAVILLAVILIGAYIVLELSVFGRRLYAVGSNRNAARAAGINDNRMIITAFAISGLLSGVAGYILVGRLGVASAGMSSGAMFLSVAAAVIGGVSLTGGQGTIQGMFGGVLVMGVIANALNLAQIPSEYVRVVTGIVILVAVFVDAVRARRFLAR